MDPLVFYVCLFIITLKLLDAKIVPTSWVPRGGGDASAVWDFCV